MNSVINNSNDPNETPNTRAFLPPPGFISKEALESEPESWMMVVGFTPLLAGEDPVARQVIGYDNLAQLRDVAEYFPELLDSDMNITPEAVEEVVGEFKSMSLEEIVESELYGTGGPGVRGRILMSAAKGIIRDFLGENTAVLDSLISQYKAKDLDHFLSDQMFGSDPAKLISIMSNKLGEYDALSNKFRDMLVDKAFSNIDMVRFIAEGGDAKYYVCKKEGETTMVVKYHRAKGADESTNTVYVRYLDDESGKLIQATIAPKAYGRGFMGSGSDRLTAGYIPEVTFQTSVLSSDGKTGFVEMTDNDQEDMRRKNPIGFLPASTDKA